MSAIDRTSKTADQANVGATQQLPDPRGALAIAEKLLQQPLDKGTAALVADLVAKLGGTTDSPRPAATATLRLSTGDDFHYGLSERIEDLAAELRRSGGDGRLEVGIENAGNEFVMTLDAFGPTPVAQAIQATVDELARGIVSVGWKQPD